MEFEKNQDDKADGVLKLALRDNYTVIEANDEMLKILDAKDVKEGEKRLHQIYIGYLPLVKYLLEYKEAIFCQFIFLYSINETGESVITSREEPKLRNGHHSLSAC